MERIENKDVQTALRMCARPEISFEDLDEYTQTVFSEVQKNGDRALFNYTEQFDQVKLDALEVSMEEIAVATKAVPKQLKEAIALAQNNIERFHKSQLTTKQIVETFSGVQCWQENRGIEKVGIYIPGGSASLFSTVLMLVVPAQLAGCKEVVLCTPPNKEGKVADEILYAASITGVNRIFKVGGGQAIAALVFGTESIPAVYKIFGPGNQYVTAAKTKAQLFGVAIDMPAGPSELLVIADDTANPSFVAADLLSQAEHGADSQVVCVVDSPALADQIQEEIQLQLSSLPRRTIALKALLNSKMIVSTDVDYILQFINGYAPEHLILATARNEELLPEIINAGSVFIGNYTPESAGDYASGTNHTLPTNGFSRAYSGVNMDAFVKKITFQSISKKGLQGIGPAIELMAEAEQLEAHKRAVSIRLKSVES